MRKSRMLAFMPQTPSNHFKLLVLKFCAPRKIMLYHLPLVILIVSLCIVSSISARRSSIVKCVLLYWIKEGSFKLCGTIPLGFTNEVCSQK